MSSDASDFTTRVASEDNTRTYVVVRVYGHLSCGCRGFLYRLTCKHVEAIKAMLETGTARIVDGKLITGGTQS